MILKKIKSKKYNLIFFILIKIGLKLNDCHIPGGEGRGKGDCKYLHNAHISIPLVLNGRPLYFYNNEPPKNKHFLIFLSSLARNSQEPKLK